MSRVIFEDLTLKQFLRLPEAKPALEFIDGKVVQKVAAKRAHSVIQTILGSRLLTEVLPEGLGLAYTELRCTFGGRSLVPDLCYIAAGRVPLDPRGEPVDDIFFPPDLAIEIISPGQTVKDLSARLDWCVRNGVRLAWLIQPRRLRVFVFRPDRAVDTLEPGASLDGGEVLPGFLLPLDEMFAWLKIR